MYIVKDDNPDVRYAMAPLVVKDAEGNVIDNPQLVVEVVSDNPDAVAVTPDADPMQGSVHFGNPGLANINATVKTAAGVLLGSRGAQFTVTTGDPAAIAGGELAFEGLTEAPAEAPAPPPVEPPPAEPPA